jgi:hypothetical protein
MCPYCVQSLERWIVTHLRPPTQFIIHEFSSTSNAVLTFDSEPREHPQFLWRIEISSLERRRSSPCGMGSSDGYLIGVLCAVLEWRS